MPGRTALRSTVTEIADGFGRHRLLTYASAMAYQIISSIIPFACFTLALAGLVGGESLWRDHLAPEVLQSTSREVYALLDQTVRQIVERQQFFWLSIGLALTVWEISGAMRAATEALDEVYGIHEHRSRRERYGISLALAAAAGGLSLLALAAVVVGPSLVGGGLVARVLSYMVAALVLAIAVGLTLRLAPSARQPVKWVSVGSVVIVVGWLLVLGGYLLYATRVASYASIFGSLAAAFLLIVGVYLAAIVFLAGVLIDAAARDETR
jgi:membrane protein